MMRIAHIVDSLKTGGAEKLVFLFAQQAALRKLPLTIVCLREDPDRNIRDSLRDIGVPVMMLPSRKRFDPIRMCRLIAFLTKSKFDIVQTHLAASNIVGGVAGYLAGAKVVSTLHSIQTDPRFFPPVLFNLETQTLRHISSRVVAVGRVLAEAHQRRFQKKIEVIPNAVDEFDCELSSAERNAIRSRLCGNATDPILISVGRLSPPKGYEVLIDAFSIVQRSHPQVKLLIAGTGLLHDQLSQKISELGLTNSIKLLGRCHNVPELLAASDIYVNASHWEGLPLSVLEAMSAGLPIVATAVGDIPYVLTKEAGCLVPPQNAEMLAFAIQAFLSNPERAHQVGKAAQDIVQKNHNPSAWTDKLLHLYEEVLESRAQPLRKAV